MALALPKLRWLVIGAIAAGVWVVREDLSGPRPPERVPTRIERSLEAKPRPQKPGAAVAKADKRPAEKPSPSKTAEKPVPPKPVTGKPVPQKTVAQKAAPQNVAPQKTALLLPKSIDRPPSKPQKIVTGSISRPGKPTFVQTKAKVFMREQARADAPIIATLGPRTVMRELARSGEWRLVLGDGRKGWVRADYLVRPTFLPRRPKLPVADVRQAKANASAKPVKAQ
ncbi:SH3 domain-containing protein [Mesorhizobium sp. KR9-304]|uniref:SH3 domain-containing protein n=1 Tax=Mesorhizobium sp. KR9-304 TaxID=3156614 RepID=UPI0032B350F7